MDVRLARLMVPLAVAAATCVAFGGNAHAATAYGLYSYDLSQLSGSTVPNGAGVNTGVALQLLGDWSPVTDGAHFTGDTTSQQSVARAKPSSGYTLNVPESDAVGVAIRFTYQAPATGTCFKDSPNITQIGRFGDKATQVKVQLSNCGKSKTAVFPQCRMAGSKSSTSVLPRQSSLALTSGTTYVLYCFQGVTSAGQRTQFLRVTPVGGAMTANEWAIPTLGALQSTSWLSVANKVPLPSIANNTDQFVGDVAKVAYCSGPTPGVVSTCLANEVPLT